VVNITMGWAPCWSVKGLRGEAEVAAQCLMLLQSSCQTCSVDCTTCMMTAAQANAGGEWCYSLSSPFKLEMGWRYHTLSRSGMGMLPRTVLQGHNGGCNACMPPVLLGLSK
jgi:hypothetical protein